VFESETKASHLRESDGVRLAATHSTIVRQFGEIRVNGRTESELKKDRSEREADRGPSGSGLAQRQYFFRET